MSIERLGSSARNGRSLAAAAVDTLRAQLAGDETALLALQAIESALATGEAACGQLRRGEQALAAARAKRDDAEAHVLELAARAERASVQLALLRSTIRRYLDARLRWQQSAARAELVDALERTESCAEVADLVAVYDAVQEYLRATSARSGHRLRAALARVSR